MFLIRQYYVKEITNRTCVSWTNFIDCHSPREKPHKYRSQTKTSLSSIGIESIGTAESSGILIECERSCRSQLLSSPPAGGYTMYKAPRSHITPPAAIGTSPRTRELHRAPISMTRSRCQVHNGTFSSRSTHVRIRRQTNTAPSETLKRASDRNYFYNNSWMQRGRVSVSHGWS